MATKNQFIWIVVSEAIKIGNEIIFYFKLQTIFHSIFMSDFQWSTDKCKRHEVSVVCPRIQLPQQLWYSIWFQENFAFSKNKKFVIKNFPTEIWSAKKHSWPIHLSVQQEKFIPISHNFNCLIPKINCENIYTQWAAFNSAIYQQKFSFCSWTGNYVFRCSDRQAFVSMSIHGASDLLWN